MLFGVPSVALSVPDILRSVLVGFPSWLAMFVVPACWLACFAARHLLVFVLFFIRCLLVSVSVVKCLVYSVVFAAFICLGTPGVDIVQWFTWLVHAFSSPVLAACSLLCKRGIVG